jgi:hypothetical protein
MKSLTYGRCDPRAMSHSFSAVTIAVLFAGCSSSGIISDPASNLATSQVTRSNSENCPAHPGGTGILHDGDFAQAVQPGYPGNAVYFKGESFAPSWKVRFDSVDFLSATYWNMDGLCSVDLDGQWLPSYPDPVGETQSSGIRTKPNYYYTVHFLLSGNGDCEPTIKKIEVWAADQDKLYSWDTSNGNDARHGKYALESWQFVAKGNSTRLRLTSGDPNGSSCGPVVAAVSVAKS